MISGRIVFNKNDKEVELLRLRIKMLEEENAELKKRLNEKESK